MGVKKGKKKKSSTKDKPAKEESKGDNAMTETSTLPEYNWIRVRLQLCDPISRHNNFKVVMRADERILELKKRIIDYHGRVDNVNIYSKDPYPPRLPAEDYRRQKKPRIPPARELSRLLALMEEKEAIEEAEEALAHKKEQNPSYREESEAERDPEGEVEDPKRFDELDLYDFPYDEIHGKKQYIVNYDE